MQRVSISTYPHLRSSYPCQERQELLRREHALRAQAKTKEGRSLRLAVELAQHALQVQKMRFTHETNCVVCQDFEKGLVA